MARGVSTSVKAYERRGRVADLGRVVRRRHPGHPRPPPGLRPLRHARRGGRARDAGRGPRQRVVRRAGRVVRPGRARRRASPSTRTCGATALAAFATETKVELALDLERAVLGRDPRVTGVRTAVVRRQRRRGRRRHEHRHGVRCGRGTLCMLSVSALADDGDETKIGGGIDVGRDPTTSTSSQAARRGRPRPCAVRGRQAAVAAARHRARAPNGGDHRSAWPAARSPASGCSRAGRRSPTGWARPSPRRCSRFVDDPTDPAIAGGRPLRRRGPGLPAQRAHRRRAAAPVPAQRLHRPPSRRTRPPARRCGATARRPASAARPSPSRPGAGTLRRAGRRRSSTASSCRVDERAALGRQRGQRRLLGRRRGPDDPRRCSWPSRCARSPSPRRCSACCSTSKRSAPTSNGCPAARPCPRSSSPTCPSAARSQPPTICLILATASTSVSRSSPQIKRLNSWQPAST